MKLYTMPGACSLADHIALHWSGLPFEVQVVDRAAIKEPAFLALNPAGSVPVLEDEGWVLTQNAAILHYISDKAPQVSLDGGTDVRSRAEVNRWLALVNADLHPAFSPLFSAGNWFKEDTVVKEIQTHARARVQNLFSHLNEQLSKHDWLAATPRASIADAYAFVVLRWARALHIDLSGLEGLDRFEQRMLADPAVQAALKTEGLA